MQLSHENWDEFFEEEEIGFYEMEKEILALTDRDIARIFLFNFEIFWNPELERNYLAEENR